MQTHLKSFEPIENHFTQPDGQANRQAGRQTGTQTDRQDRIAFLYNSTDNLRYLKIITTH